MTTASVQTLEDAIRDAGGTWLLHQYGLSTPTESLHDLRQKLQMVSSHAQQRLGCDAPDLGEAALVAEYQLNPLKVKAFFQVLSGAKSPQMLLMAWRILQGMEIKSIEMTYRRRSSFSVRVLLESATDGSVEEYESINIQDFSLFRHLGIMEINDKPILDGFYAWNLQE